MGSLLRVGQAGKVLVTFGLFIVLFTSVSFADDMKELVSEFLNVAGGESGYQQIIIAINNQIQQQLMDRMQKDMQNRKNLTPERQQEMIELMKASLNRVVKKFNEYLFEEIPFEKIVEEVYLPIYEENFSADELRKLIELYKNPTAKKFIKLTPKMMEESMRKFDDMYMDGLQMEMKVLMQNELNTLKRKMKDGQK